jgi:hypothetical protein
MIRQKTGSYSLPFFFELLWVPIARGAAALLFSYYFRRFDPAGLNRIWQ